MSHRTRAGARLATSLAAVAVLGLTGAAAASPAAAAPGHGPGHGPGHAPARAGQDGAVVRAPAGAVAGVVGADYRAFLGIPYAAPPVGALRWRAPQPAATWSGVRAATAFGSPCPSLPTIVAGASGAGSTNEDCLFLNVFTPLDARPGLPVMVWIHGGGFVNGAGSDYDARVLTAKAHAVVVTINYRLNAFGFLALPGLSAEAPDGSSGDFGLADQQAALRWVRRNVASFGGNPGNVTIFGESAGGASVCAALASPTARGLFQRAIIESGPCVRSFVGALPTTAQAEQAGAALAAGIGCADAATQVACMRAKPVSEILAATGGALGRFGPVVGGRLLPQQIATAITSGRFNRVPTIQGTNHDEYRLFTAVLFDLVGHPISAAAYPAVLAAQFGAAAPAVLAAYPLSSYPSPGIAYSAAVTDASFSCPAKTTDDQLARHTLTFGYEFNDENAPPFLFTDPLMPLGAFHASEIPFVFQPPADQAALLFTPAQQALSDRMIGYWARFAATGNPNGFGSPLWLPYRPRTPLVQSFAPARTGPIGTFAADHHCAFWASLTG